MMPMTLAEIARIVDGTVADASGEDDRVTGGAFVDTRTPVAGGLFVAVPGEHVDGHDFAADAVRAGAAGVLGAHPTGVPTVVVPDPVRALGRLARHIVGALRPTVLALTGSQGKTGTKDFLAQLLAPAGPTVFTEGNQNNEIGVPLTVLRTDAQTRFLALEMGARGTGHIAELCRIAPPEIAAVLNVGTAHLGEFGSREAIASTKGEIVEALPSTGTAVLNADDDLVAAMAHRTSARLLTFGTTGDVRWRGLELDELGRPSFELGYDGQWVPVRLLEAGAHQVANAAAAAAMAAAAGVPWPDVVTGLGSARSLSLWRMAICRASRRTGGRQRQLQRQPRVDGGGPRHAGRHRRAQVIVVPSRCSARCSSSGPRRAWSTRRSGRTRHGSASMSCWPWARGRGRSRRVHVVRRAGQEKR